MATMTAVDFDRIMNEARVKAAAAVAKTTPTPMLVGTPANGWDGEFDTNKPIDYVAGGMCGMAGVVIPARGNFVKWLTANGIGHKNGFTPGYYINASAFFKLPGALWQSYELNRAIAVAVAAVFNDNGIKATVDAWID